MNASAVNEKLLAEGCVPNSFAVLSRESDALCLLKNGVEWIVVYSERGNDSKPYFRSFSEEDACEFFYDLVMKEPHLHMVFFSRSIDEAEQFQTKVKNVGIETIRNDIPHYMNENDTRARVFVKGKDIFRFEQEFGKPEFPFT
ncbi:SPOR domain-containing protein [Psychrosphaera algicola]|uniref:SPOR domain-containing protein n=1 Tax=Psychrosphaera algicola TaxID=3023714 RepID=A0ABT5FC48_9GAMM|nr:SPOR domain-containing protein [Psychrosphaera sp. G1-22]MDC2888971.1 SPOR domain-containing protein [Psychrosphaera sp. G1-22]